jgi:hypothetical protein
MALIILPKFKQNVLLPQEDKKEKPKQNNKNHRWGKFTYTGRETLFITKIKKRQNCLLHEQHSREAPVEKTGRNHQYI